MAVIGENLSSSNLRAVEELILDEQKLVTYISLSKDLCIHVNDAKKLLAQVVEEIKRKNTDVRLNINFIISGLFSNNSGRTMVCSESDLETQRSAFKTVFYHHIYSVNKGSSGVDYCSIAFVNKFEDFLLCGGLIKGSRCTKRSSDEIESLKSNSQKCLEQKTVAPLKTEIKDKKKDVAQIGISENNVKVHETKSEPVVLVKSEAPSPKKGTASNSNGKSKLKNGIKSSKDIAGFFTKSNSAPISKSNTIVDKKTVEKPTSKTEIQCEIKTETKQEIKDECMDVDEEISVKKIKKDPESTKKSNGKKNSSLNQIKKNAKVDKKRKRVLHVSDSESDDDPFADEKPANPESDDEIPPTPSINTVKITSGILNPKKRRKIVDKTYTDEEGYILTRKEEVYESCSEEEVEAVKLEPVQVKPEKENVEKPNKVKVEVSPKEKKAKNTRKKVSPPQKGKQSTLTSFFKKK